MNNSRKKRHRNLREGKETTTAKIVIHPSAIDLLTDATWEFAQAQLWSHRPFTELEASISKDFIREYYQAIPADVFQERAASHLTAYCERILLAKKYANRFSHRFIPHPWIWLNKDNPKGFAGTKKWYEQELAKRAKQQAFLPVDLRRLLGIISFTL
jgi:hypothetical protein